MLLNLTRVHFLINIGVHLVHEMVGFLLSDDQITHSKVKTGQDYAIVSPCVHIREE